MTPNKKLLLAAGTAGLAGLGFGYLAHDNIKQHAGYAGYLFPHKWHTGKAAYQMDLPLSTVLGHDLSKFRPDEWSAYSAWFNGPKGLQGTQDPKLYMEWRKEVGRHYERNPHHWRALHKSPNEVPVETKLESIADWYGVNRAKGITRKPFKEWFMERKEKFPIDKPTVEEAERRLFKTAFMPLGLGKDLKTTAKTVSKAVTDLTPLAVTKENPFPKNSLPGIKPVDVGFPKLAKQKTLQELFITTERPLTGHELPVSAFTHEPGKNVWTTNDGGTDSRHNVAGGLMGTEKISTLRRVFKVPSIKTSTKAPEETAAGDKEVTTTFVGETLGTGGSGSSK